MKTITSLQSYFIALLILFTSTTVKSQVFCDPDLDPPTFTDCNIGNIVLDIINPTYCYAAVVGWPEPLATDFCTQTQLISSSFDRFFEYYDEGILGLNGQLILHGDDSITIVGTTNGVPFTNRVYQVCYYSTCDGTLSFDFRSRMNNGDGFNGDRARFMIQNAITGTSLTDVLTPPPGNGNLATGSRSYPVSYGDRVCFEVQSDNFLGVNSLTISNLIFTSSAVVVTQISGPRRASHLAPGNYSVVYRATDCAGNSSTCQGTIQVNTAPGHVLSNCSQDTVILLDDPTNCDTLLDGLIPIVNNYCTSFKNFYSYFYPSAKSPLPFPYITKTGPNSDGISGTDGFAMVDPSGDLMIVGTSNGTPPDPIQLKFDTSQVIAHVSIPCRGNATFDWTAMMRRVFATFLYDEAGYKKYDDSTGTYDQVILSVPALANFASGSESVYFSSAGGYLEFYVNSGNLAFRDTLTVSNFVFTPEPTVLEQTCGPDLTQAVGPGVYEMCYEATDCFGTTERCTYELTVRNDFTLGCKDINVSLDSLCTAVITPAMLIAGPSCTATMVVELSHYNHVIANPLDTNYLNKVVIGRVTDTLTGNSCWSNILVEDKLAPTIICRADTIDCYRFEHDLPLQYTGYDCSPYTVTATGDRTEHLECDERYLKRVYRDIKISDDLGNVTECTDTIVVERITAGDIDFPIGEEPTELECDDIDSLDENGHPHPWVTGYATFISEGQEIEIRYPTMLIDCRLHVSYSDVDLGEISCVRKIMRTWTVREWWCNTEIVRSQVQLIIIRDTKGPRILHGPYDFEATTGHKGCYANVNLPAIESVDNCHGIFRTDMIYPGGSQINKNGGLAVLPVGEDTVYYRVYDQCYNVTEDTLIVTVTDDTEPIAICDRRTVVAINEAGYNWVPAEVFDDGSFDECGLHHFEVRRMDRDSCNIVGEDDWGPEVGFCCGDVGQTVMVGLKVIDRAGNEAICMITVEVQDKNRPSIVCPPNIEVDCRFSYDINHLGYSFGKVAREENQRDTIVIDPRYWHYIDGHPFDGIGRDNCDITITEEIDTSGMNQCGMGIIVRKFVAEDRQGSKDSCYQRISIENHHPMSDLSIDWPDDYEVSNICDPGQLRPELLNAPYNVPTFVDDECSLVGMDYKDHIFSATVPGDPCYKILRVWKVIDWCYRDEANDIVIFVDTQIIKVSNTIDPVITKLCRDTTICSYDAECRPIPVTLSIEATDFCTNSNEILYRYKIDYNSDGIFDVNVAQIGNPTASGTWPLGRHIIKWEVEDRCGNTATCQSELNLLNCKPPTAYAHKDLAVGLTGMDTDGNGTPDAKMAIIWATDLDAGSNHNCGYALKYSFSKDTNDTRRVYTCDSIGPRNVELWVTDPQGNTSYVRTIIIVNDNPQQEPKCPGRLNVRVNGLIRSNENEKVEYVEVNLDNSNVSASRTNYEGEYSFPVMPAGGSYVLRPQKNEEWLNGISTADIVKIQKHILGKEMISTAYDMIAADVNHSGSVTTADISELRKLILGINSEISRNTSWRFVLEQYSFGSVEKALEEQYPETYEINNLSNDVSTNFIGIKIGDLNHNAKTRGLQGQIKTRSERPMEVSIENVGMKKDEIREILLSSNNIEQMQGFQFTVEVNPQLGEIVEVQGNRENGLGEEHFNLSQMHEGKISVSWNGQAEQKKLMSIKIRSKVNGRIGDILHLTSGLTQALSVDKQGEEGKVELRTYNGITEEMIVLQNEPNPWKNMTSIGIILPEGGEAQLTIYDISGKVLYKQSRELQRSYNEWKIDQGEISKAGVYYYQVDYRSQTKTNKMIVLE